MPGPRTKQNTGKRSRQKVASPNNEVVLRSASESSPTIPMNVLNVLDEISNYDWDKVARVLCDYFELPDLMTRSGLKKVYHDFPLIYKRTNDTYVAYERHELVRGGIVAIYVKMCADSILRNMLFHREGLLAKIITLINQPSSRHLALRALTTITQHGGSDIRKKLSLYAPILIQVLKDFPDDLYAAELAISTVAHAVTCSSDDPEKLPSKYVKALQLRKLIPLVLSFVGKPGVSLPLLHHALELFAHLTQHYSQDCLLVPDMIDFLIACIRSGDMHSRVYALGAVIRLHSLKPERMAGDPYALLAAMERGLPEHLSKLLLEYGRMRCESTLTLRSFAEYHNAMLKCAEDHDLYKLGLALAELIPRNEFAISEGSFQAINERTGKTELMDVGLPFKMWVDALPLCAKAIRERGKAGEDDLADMLEMKYFVLRSRIPDAVELAQKGVERNPKLSYPYYIMTLGEDEETGLRFARKGLKCENTTPFVSHALRARATEIAGNLALCRMQESIVGDQKWEQGQAFLSSALDDARIYLAQAPPDMRHRKSILYWYILLTLVEKGPKLSIGLHELQEYTEMLKIADDFFTEFGVVAPKSPLCFAYEHISSRYAAAANKWGLLAVQLKSHGIDQYILSRDKAEDRLAAWLRGMQDEDGDGECESPGSCPRQSKKNVLVLHRCSWCRNPSAVLRKCGRCEKARYCDSSCQKLAWSEHKTECRSYKK